jgi:hypothetical protein
MRLLWEDLRTPREREEIANDRERDEREERQRERRVVRHEMTPLIWGIRGTAHSDAPKTPTNR